MSQAEVSVKKLSKTFAALANPIRLQILDRLRSGQATVSEIAEPFSISLPGVTNHINVLEKAGLISKSKDAQWRPTELNANSFRDIDRWLHKYRVLWEEQLDKLEDYIEELQDTEGDK